MSLLDNFRNAVSKSKVNGTANKAEFDVMYPTGFLSLDYLNGTVVHVQDKETHKEFSYNSTGIVDGSTNMIIGRSGSGKSTLIQQIAAGIVKPFIRKGMDSQLLVDDIEGSLPQSRKEFLWSFTEEELAKYTDTRNTGITTENLLQRIAALRDEKISNRKKYEYDTGLYDTYGNRIFKLVPSVYICDSLAMLMPEDVNEDDSLGTNMNGATVAKANTVLIKKIAQYCKEANIIFFTVNHILPDINTGFIKKAAQISGLKEGERISGGRVATYLANNLFRVDDSLTLKATDGMGIDGSVVYLSIVKSRTNTSKKSVPLIFNKTDGKFDQILSLFYLLKTEAVFKGTGAYMYLEDVPDVKFGQKNFKERLGENPELQKAFAKECYQLLSTYLSDTRIESAEETKTIDNVIDLFNGFANGEGAA